MSRGPGGVLAPDEYMGVTGVAIPEASSCMNRTRWRCSCKRVSTDVSTLSVRTDLGELGDQHKYQRGNVHGEQPRVVVCVVRRGEKPERWRD
jgi:hypothetical protein